jgi:UDP-N-acetylglucosamine--N-acetylmuramyl-(pentapeptide) pyrophosphoryl-undecaprenol N-acetylglucosamine transferase
MAGGTGGHVFPALAVALFLKNEDWDVRWIGTEKGMESKVVPAQGIEIDYLSVAGIRGKGMISKIQSVLFLCRSFGQAFKIFRRHKPDAVIGFGGYASGPGGLVASLLRIPLLIHEQNRVPGTTNRLLVNRANKVLEAFPDSFLAKVQAEFTGNPLRNDFLDFPEKVVWTEKLGRNFRILVVGGSQGAKILNDTVPAVIERLEAVDVVHQTGSAAHDKVSKKI